MEIPGVYGSDEGDLDFGGGLQEVSWNGRTVTRGENVEGVDFHRRVSLRIPMPNHTEVEIEGEYRQGGGSHVKGKVSVGWDWPQPSGEPKGSSRETNNAPEKKDAPSTSRQNGNN